jgi:superfamily I DNA and/or RNA helicase
MSKLNIHLKINSSLALRYFKNDYLFLRDVTRKRSTIPIKHFLFFNLKSGVENTDNDSNSWSNEIEAQFVYELCKYLVKSNFKNIGIITPYQKQLKLIQNFLRKK